MNLMTREWYLHEFHRLSKVKDSLYIELESFTREWSAKEREELAREVARVLQMQSS